MTDALISLLEGREVDALTKSVCRILQLAELLAQEVVKHRADQDDHTELRQGEEHIAAKEVPVSRLTYSDCYERTDDVGYDHEFKREDYVDPDHASKLSDVGGPDLPGLAFELYSQPTERSPSETEHQNREAEHINAESNPLEEPCEVLNHGLRPACARACTGPLASSQPS